jgi:hypothetical protein
MIALGWYSEGRTVYEPADAANGKPVRVAVAQCPNRDLAIFIARAGNRHAELVKMVRRYRNELAWVADHKALHADADVLLDKVQP